MLAEDEQWAKLRMIVESPTRYGAGNCHPRESGNTGLSNCGVGPLCTSREQNSRTRRPPSAPIMLAACCVRRR